LSRFSRPRGARACATASLIALASLSASSTAFAAPTDEADALFEDGRRMMDDGNLAEACPKLERSFQLAPRLGTMLNLGSCFERRGELARALSLYERAATLARQTGRADRESAARELAASLESKVAKVLVVSREPSANLVLQVDGEILSTRSGLVPLDPGSRRLTARAPGRVPFEVVLELKKGETTTVTIPKLREEGPPPAAATAPPATGPSVRTIAAAGGLVASVAGLGLGTFFGLRAKSKHDESSSMCDATGCTAQGLALVDDAQTAGNVSTVSFVVSGVVLAATITAWVLTAPRATATTPTRAARAALFTF
jgi:hypothetical protein